MATVAKPAVPPIVPRMAPREDLNPFRIAQIQFDMAAEYLKLDPGLRQILRTPQARPGSCRPRKMDNGRSKCSPDFACSTTWRAARQGRPPLSPQRHARRSESARRVDDLEDGHR